MGRVWPRHRHRGRPLNSVVSRHLNSARASVWLGYVMIGLVVVGWITKFLWFARDPFWDQMNESRQTFYILGAGTIVFALAVAYGLWRRREWGRVFGMSFSVVMLFTFVGMPLMTPLLAPEIGINFEWDSVLMGILSTACLIGLSRSKFEK